MITSEGRSRVPWHATDPIVLYLGSLVGMVMIFVSWYNASGSARLSTQVAWVNLGVAGIVVSGTVNALWLLSGRRAVGERRRMLLAWAEARWLPPAVPAGGAPTALGEAEVQNGRSAEVQDGGHLVSGAGMTRYHRESCLLVAGKATAPASRDHHLAAGRRPCGICQP